MIFCVVLRKRLENDFFGQHIAYDRVITALDAHLQDPKPGKALVFSFHGWAGSGKTFLAQLIIESLFKRGMESSYMKFYLGSLHFPDESKVKEYQVSPYYQPVFSSKLASAISNGNFWIVFLFIGRFTYRNP